MGVVEIHPRSSAIARISCACRASSQAAARHRRTSHEGALAASRSAESGGTCRPSRRAHAALGTAPFAAVAREGVASSREGGQRRCPPSGLELTARLAEG